MGVTVHWQGSLLGNEAYSALVSRARLFAVERGWPIQEIDPTDKVLARVIDELPVDYEGPTHGIVLWPHPDCEPVVLEFDRDLFTQEYCKTQFAGADVHIEIVNLLRLLTPYFVSLRVTDEGEYWETGSREVLAAHIDKIASILSEMLAGDPKAKSPVVLASGRVLDFTGSKKRT
jgi:hypothetical protein